MCLCWDTFRSSYILMHVHICGIRVLCEVSPSEGQPKTTPTSITHMWLGRVIMCRIIVGCFNMPFSLNGCISDRLRDGLTIVDVVAGHMGVLKNNTKVNANDEGGSERETG